MIGAAACGRAPRTEEWVFPLFVFFLPSHVGKEGAGCGILGNGRSGSRVRGLESRRRRSLPGDRRAGLGPGVRVRGGPMGPGGGAPGASCPGRFRRGDRPGAVRADCPRAFASPRRAGEPHAGEVHSGGQLPRSGPPSPQRDGLCPFPGALGEPPRRGKEGSPARTARRGGRGAAPTRERRGDGDGVPPLGDPLGTPDRASRRPASPGRAGTSVASGRRRGRSVRLRERRRGRKGRRERTGSCS